MMAHDGRIVIGLLMPRVPVSACTITCMRQQLCRSKPWSAATAQTSGMLPAGLVAAALKQGRLSDLNSRPRELTAPSMAALALSPVITQEETQRRTEVRLPLLDGDDVVAWAGRSYVIRAVLDC